MRRFALFGMILALMLVVIPQSYAIVYDLFMDDAAGGTGQRHYQVYETSGPGAMMILALCGTNGTPGGFMRSSGLYPYASLADAVVIAPEPQDKVFGGKKWRDSDVPWLVSLVQRALIDYECNPDQVIGIGFSSGGGMIQRLGAKELNGQLKAVGVVCAGVPPGVEQMLRDGSLFEHPCPAVRISIVQDKTVTDLEARTGASVWARLNGLSGDPQLVHEDVYVIEERFYPAQGADRTVHYSLKLPTGEHEWPHAAEYGLEPLLVMYPEFQRALLAYVKIE